MRLFETTYMHEFNAIETDIVLAEHVGRAKEIIKAEVKKRDPKSEIVWIDGCTSERTCAEYYDKMWEKYYDDGENLVVLGIAEVDMTKEGVVYSGRYE